MCVCVLCECVDTMLSQDYNFSNIDSNRIEAIWPVITHPLKVKTPLKDVRNSFLHLFLIWKSLYKNRILPPYICWFLPINSLIVCSSSHPPFHPRRSWNYYLFLSMLDNRNDKEENFEFDYLTFPSSHLTTNSVISVKRLYVLDRSGKHYAHWNSGKELKIIRLRYRRWNFYL